MNLNCSFAGEVSLTWGRIITDSEIRHGRPIIKGTRFPVDIILGSLAGGMDIAEIIKEYDIEKGDVLAALAYAAKVVVGEVYVPMPDQKFLLDADMPKSSAWVIKSLGLDVVDVMDIGMRATKDKEIID